MPGTLMAGCCLQRLCYTLLSETDRHVYACRVPFVYVYIVIIYACWLLIKYYQVRSWRAADELSVRLSNSQGLPWLFSR